MSDSNRYSYSQSRRVTITLHPLYGGAGGNRTRVRKLFHSGISHYSHYTFIPSAVRLMTGFFSVAFQRALAIPSNLSQGAQWFAHLHHLVSFSSNKENCAFGRIFTSYIHPSSRYVVLESYRQSGGNPLSHKSSKSGMDHNDSFSVVVSFLFKPWGGLLPASLALSKPRRILYGPIWSCQSAYAWSGQKELNFRHNDYQSCALPTELYPVINRASVEPHPWLIGFWQR